MNAAPITMSSLSMESDCTKDAYTVSDGFESYYENARRYKELMPSVVGMPAMDAIALLENLQVKVKVKLKGSGIIKSQSVGRHQKLQPNQTIILEAS